MVTTRRGSSTEQTKTDATNASNIVTKASDGAPQSGVLGAYPRVVYAVFIAILKTIFASDYITTTNRTAVFLMFFLVIHCLGNFLVFVGADAFNAYGHLLHVNPLLKVIETYLLLACVFHSVAGLQLTWRKRKFITKGSPTTVLSNAKMAISSLAVVAFIVVHLVQFRFGPWYDYASTMDVTVISEAGIETVPKGTAMRDLFRLEREVFANPVNVVGYILGIVVLGAHLWWGWARAVGKLGLPQEDQPAAEAIGKFGCILPMMAAFAAQPAYVLLYLH